MPWAFWNYRQIKHVKSHDKAFKVSFTLHIFLWLMGGALAASASLLILWLVLNKPSLPPQGRILNAGEVYSAIKLALAVVAGVGGVVALVVAYRKQRLGEDEHLLARAGSRREDTKLYTERFRSAADQLGSDKAAVRLAGAYAMQELADDWKSGRQMCVDVLCAYLRMPYSGPYSTRRPKSETADASSTEAGALSADAQAGYQELQVRLSIQRILAARLGRGGPAYGPSVGWPDIKVNLAGSDLVDADFSNCSFQSADFSNARFHGGARLIRCYFEDESTFEGAIFYGEAAITGSLFEEHCDFSTCQFMGEVYAIGVVVHSGLEFHRSTFHRGLMIDKLNCIDGHVYFYGSVFEGAVRFGSTAKLGGSLDLRNVTLRPRSSIDRVPDGWKIHDGTFVGSKIKH
jgi:hypothetical protein